MENGKNEVPDAMRTEEVYGIAKKVNLELEKFALHSHAAVVALLKLMVEHRKTELESQMSQQQEAAQKAAYDDALKAHARAAVEEEERKKRQLARQAQVDAATGGLKLVSDTAAAPAEELVVAP